jgi:hypothetical protein
VADNSPDSEHGLVFGGLPLPRLITDAGDRASRRFIEFFTANIRNPNTREAYARAVGQFLSWSESRGLQLESIGPVAIAAYIEQHDGSKPTVKVLSIGQIHRMWWLDRGIDAVRERLKILCDGDWLVPIRLAAKAVDYFPSRPLAEPIESATSPEFRNVLAVTQSRWAVPIRVVTAFVASSRAAHFFGGHARHPRPSEATHDLFLAGVYLRFLEERPSEADAWIGEGRLSVEAAGTAGVIPDSLVRRDGGCLAIEVVGESYPESKLQAFHEYCVRRGWRYELW